MTRRIRRSMAEVADASGGAWRELDAHYVHQSRMIGMAVDIQAWPADSAEYPSALGARLRDLPPVDAMQLLQFLDLIPRPEKVEPQLAKACRDRARLSAFRHDGSWGTPAERSRLRSVDPPERVIPLP